MPLQLVEITAPQARREEIEGLLAGVEVQDRSSQPLEDGRILVRVVLDSGRTEPILDEFRRRFPDSECRAFVMNIEASSPPLATPLAPPPATTHLRLVDFLPWTRKLDRVSRQELVATLSEGSRLTPVFVTLVLLSTIVAAVGFYENNVGLIIGAMLIAPLLGPNVSLCLATTLAEGPLARRAAGAIGTGVALVVAVTAAIGAIHPISGGLPEVSLRTHPGIGDLAVAIAVGVAAVLSYTSRLSTLLVGVAVAVALVPPFAVSGLLIGSGDLGLAQGAFLLGIVNLIGINLAGTVTLAVQGVRPVFLFEKYQARRATAVALGIWAALFGVLVVILLSTGGSGGLLPHILP